MLTLTTRILPRYAVGSLASRKTIYDRLRRPSPVMPTGFGNRLAANWKMMLAIGELCGVGDKARAAAVALSRRNDEASLGVELLRDIRDLFKQRGVDRLRSEDLTNKLGEMADRPWAELPWTGKPITQPQLAKLLKGYGVRPKQIRFGGTPSRGTNWSGLRRCGGTYPLTPPRGRNSETNAEFGENAETSFASVSENVSAKTAENSHCFGVSPDLPPPGDPPVECARCSGEGCGWCQPEPGSFEPEDDLDIPDFLRRRGEAA